jgi:hypothetical protein
VAVKHGEFTRKKTIMDNGNLNDKLHFTLFQNNRRVEIDAFVIEKTDDGFMQEKYNMTESDHQMIGKARRRVWRMFNQPQHYCVEPSPEFGKPLPDYCVTAWLSSGPVPERDPTPSKMVIVFFCDYVTGMCPEGLFTLNLYNLDWDGKAWTADEIQRDKELDDWVLRD